MDAEAQLLDVCNELLNKIRENPENKKCFDCSDSTSPRYVCTDFNTFVCSCCANIHKEFGHEIKVLNLFAFTLNEILMLRDSGNKLAGYRWLANWRSEVYPEPDPMSTTYKESAREYMRIKYVEKRWVPKTMQASPSADAFSSDSGSEDWAHAHVCEQLHDDKPPSPQPLRATNFSTNNPFVSPLSRSTSPYVSSPNRMSFPPQNGQLSSVTIDLHHFNKTPSQLSPNKSHRPVSASYNPFLDDSTPGEASPIRELIQRSPFRSRTMKDFGTNKTVDDLELFKPVVRLRSASAHCLLNSASEGSFGEPITLPSGGELRFTSRDPRALKFPSKALPPTPAMTKPAPPEAAPPPLSLKSPALPASVKDLKEGETRSFPRSPLKLNALVKVLSMRMHSPNSESAPTTPTEGEPSLTGESAHAASDIKGNRVQGLMTKVAGLLPKRPAAVKN